MSFMKQQRDFQASMASAASKMAKRTLPNPQASAVAAAAKSAPRRTPEPTTIAKSKVVYSQPADTGVGSSIQTMVLYARDYLKEKRVPVPLDDILGYLSKQDDEAFRIGMARILQRHNQVVYDATGFNGKGSYKFKPMHNVSNGTELLAIMQAQSTFKSLPVKELKEGWADVEAGITELERERKALVLRNKKDNTARFVWADDPSLAGAPEDEIRELWEVVKVPQEEQVLIDAIVQEGQQTASKVNKKIVNNGPAKIEKRSKKPRRGGKVTNKHMVGILKDFEHLHR